MSAKDKVCAEIQEIMADYREQLASPRGVDTPGGLEHLGDVWRLLGKWDALLVEYPSSPHVTHTRTMPLGAGSSVESPASSPQVTPAKCPECDSTSEAQAAKLCNGNEDSCPMCDKPFIDRWPSQAEFNAYQAEQIRIADAQCAGSEVKPRTGDKS